ncbi:MAG: PQQ-binding-like beta-propeller repeat protein [Planctomycetota bacterium]
MSRSDNTSPKGFAAERRILAASLLLVTGLVVSAGAEPEWPRFRGPDAAGEGAAPGLASEWTDASYLWQTELGGVGHGSPVLGGGKVFATTGDPATGESELVALDAATGAEEWRRRQPGGERHLHAMNSYASTTPALDDERVYLTGATPDGVYCAAYSHAGEELWRRPLGPYISSHGFACSPVVDEGIVYLADDHTQESSIIALDAATGEIAWRAERPAGDKSAYATPLLTTAGGRRVLVTQSKAAGMAGLDPATGESLWRLPEVFPARCVSSPVQAEGDGGVLVLGACGGGGGGKQLVAVRLDGGTPTEAYRMRRSVPYVPTPLVIGELLVLWHDRGTLAAADAATGKVLWEERIGGKFFASPVSLGGGVVLNVSNAGEAVLARIDAAGCEVLARNDLGEPTHASPAVAGGRLYLRTESKLLCLAGTQTAAGQGPRRSGNEGEGTQQR